MSSFFSFFLQYPVLNKKTISYLARGGYCKKCSSSCEWTLSVDMQGPPPLKKGVLHLNCQGCEYLCVCVCVQIYRIFPHQGTRWGCQSVKNCRLQEPGTAPTVSGKDSSTIHIFLSTGIFFKVDSCINCTVAQDCAGYGPFFTISRYEYVKLKPYRTFLDPMYRYTVWYTVKTI